ncbi:MAG: transcriptional repressor [Elusimicrobia bacterium]|nr:transcriptional repressor [Elusimicrobiota bacterium]
MRNTHQRLEILKLLSGDKSHPSAKEIHKRLKKKLPSVSFATVYNNLSKMEKAGEILCVDAGLREKRYDPCVKPHGHFLCLKCKNVFDFSFKNSKPNLKKFKIFNYSFQAKGLCAKCAKKEGGKNGRKK